MTARKNQQELLLLKDVQNLGRKGDLVQGAKPGFIRNFLVPHGHAVVADKRTIRMRERLQKEREEQAAVDRKASEEIAAKINGKTYEHTVKVDSQGHLYGSVSAQDIVHILEAQGVKLERRMVLIGQPIKTLGVHTVPLGLKEDVKAEVKIRVQDDQGRIEVIVAAPAKPAKEEPFAEEQEVAAAVDEEIMRENEQES